MELPIDFNVETPGIAAILIAIIILLFLFVIGWQIMSWYAVAASNHTAMVCIGRYGC